MQMSPPIVLDYDIIIIGKSQHVLLQAKPFSRSSLPRSLLRGIKIILMNIN